MHKCKLIIKDEINIKLEGLPVEIRRKLANRFKYIDPTAKFRPAVKLGRWDGSIAFFSIGGDGYLVHLPEILEILANNDVEITEIVDDRIKVDLNFDSIMEDFWGDTLWPSGHAHAGKQIRIREDQVEAINLFLQNPQSIQCLSTSFGKTITVATLSKICEKYGRTIIIVPNKSLVEQTEEDYINCSLDVGVYYGDRKELNKTHTICTWQSLNILEKRTKDTTDTDILTLKKFLHGVSTVIVDEVHQAKSTILRSLLTQHFRHTPIRWGVTGTIPKEDFNTQSLYSSIGPLVHTVKASELQEKGILSTCLIHICQLMDLPSFSKYPDELKYLVTNKARVEYMAKMISNIAESGNTLILVGRIDTGKMLATAIPGAVFVSGNVKTKDRKDEYDTFQTENSKILIATAGVAAVGINIVSIYNLVLIEPGKSFVRVIQSIGRGLRKGFDKTHVDVWDIASTCKFSRRHLNERKRFYKEANYKFTVEKIDWDGK